MSRTAKDAAPRVAIVTGGSRGIGRDTVLRLASRGVRTIFTFKSNRVEADALVALTKEAGVPAIALELDTGVVRACSRTPASSRRSRYGR
ncbi:SDR family NAD(P)-dependent oxidoreductase [Pandoraea nosoerga]|uniref:SDR family NAD(P)-dependent oxidoreductase n=1 Tax=Pandoraea nosoerga TaxID=2508296 RepID=UPI001F11E561|nr:SDR family NAD(P)-dependent oxidoreductase [Pandoraea nosoerga]